MVMVGMCSSWADSLSQSRDGTDAVCMCMYVHVHVSLCVAIEFGFFFLFHIKWENF